MRLTLDCPVLMTLACVWIATSDVDASDTGYNAHRLGGGGHHGYGGHQGYGGGAGLGHHVGRYGEESSTHTQKGNDYQKDSKYYYGGQYKGTCQGDGLYYKDDTTFVMCSNGYSHQQPCPPGTKTSGSPSYKAGYYYGYTDLCSVNLVDYGLGPEHYAPVGYSRVATKDAVKEVHQHGTGHGSELYAEKEVATSYNQRPLGYHGNSHHGNSHHVNSHHSNSHHVNSHQKHVDKEKGYNSGDGSSYTKKENEVKDTTYQVGGAGGYASHGSGYPSGVNHGASSTSYTALSHHRGAGYPARDGSYSHRTHPVNTHSHRVSSHGVYPTVNAQHASSAYSRDAAYSAVGDASVGAGYPTLNTYATKTNSVYSSGQGAVGVVRGTLSAVGGGDRANYGYPQHGAGEYASARAFHAL